MSDILETNVGSETTEPAGQETTGVETQTENNETSSFEETQKSFDALNQTKEQLNNIEESVPEKDDNSGIKSKADLVEITNEPDSWFDEKRKVKVDVLTYDDYADVVDKPIDNNYSQKIAEIDKAIKESMKAVSDSFKSEMSTSINKRLGEYSINEEKKNILVKDVLNDHLPFINQMIADGKEIDFPAITSLVNKSLEERLSLYNITKNEQDSVNNSKNTDFPLETQEISGATGKPVYKPFFGASTRDREKQLEEIKKRIG